MTRRLGHLTYVNDSPSPETPQLQIHQFWPNEEIHTLGESTQKDLSELFDGDWSPPNVIGKLSSFTVSFDVERGHTTGIKVHKRAIPPQTEWEWCPVVEQETPFQVQAAVAGSSIPWTGPAPEEHSPDVHVITNGKYVSGLTIKKNGRGFQLAIKTSPLSMPPRTSNSGDKR